MTVWRGCLWLVGSLLIVPVKGYQWFIRPLLPPLCRFEPSCSNYFIQAVRKHGPVIGPLEATVTDRREAELAALGLVPLLPLRGGSGAVVVSVPTLARPAEHDDPEAAANARLATRLNVLLPTWRFAHYLRCIARDRVGSFQTADELREHLQTWLMNYVDAEPDHSSVSTKAKYPLSAAELVVDDPADSEPRMRVSAYLRPQHQIEGLSAALRTGFSLPQSHPMP